MDTKKEYWEVQQIEGRLWQEYRYKDKGMVWGSEEGPTVPYACELFKSKGFRNILVIGCGYGRECIYFAREGFEVLGIDTSIEGIKIAKKWIKQVNLSNIKLKIDNALNLLIDDNSIDCVFTHKVFHQFNSRDRKKMLKEIYRVLIPKGVMVLSDFSDKDPDYNNGIKIEEHTFERKGRPFRPIYYMSNERLEEFKIFNLLDIREVKIEEAHPGELVSHEHNFLCITGEKDERK